MQSCLAAQVAGSYQYFAEYLIFRFQMHPILLPLTIKGVREVLTNTWYI